MSTLFQDPPTQSPDEPQSLFVALYFACVDDWSSNGAVWVFHADTVTRESGTVGSIRGKDFDQERLCFSDPVDKNLMICSLVREFPRIIAQQGLFTIAGDPSVDHADVLEERLGHRQHCDKRILMLKLIIPAKFKTDFMHKLCRMNITAASLFHGIDGLGLSIRETISLTVNPIVQGPSA